MGLFKRLAGRPSTSAEAEEPPIEMPRKKSSFVVPSSEPVTEASLKVFRGLPVAIRHDPSMVSFQQEHERWKGKRKFNLVSVSRRHRRCFSQHPKPDFIFYRFSIAFINLHPVGRQIPPPFITRFLRAPLLYRPPRWHFSWTWRGSVASQRHWLRALRQNGERRWSRERLRFRWRRVHNNKSNERRRKNWSRRSWSHRQTQG